MGMKKQTALMNHWQLCQYLRKLHLPQVVPPPDLATLKLLQDAHLKYVPYENLDILSGRLTSLEHDDMFAKIIMKNRGGICFELNGLYNWLLESLGYKLCGPFYRPAGGIPDPPASGNVHRTGR